MISLQRRTKGEVKRLGLEVPFSLPLWPPWPNSSAHPIPSAPVGALGIFLQEATAASLNPE